MASAWQRKVAACLLSLLATTLILIPIARAADADAVPIIDCHVHLWDIARPAGLGWIKQDNQTLYRSFLPADHEPIARANGVSVIIVVQAGQSLPRQC